MRSNSWLIFEILVYKTRVLYEIGMKLGKGIECEKAIDMDIEKC